MGWTYDPNSQTTDDGHDLLRRTDLDEAVERLRRAGIRNRSLLVDVLQALSGLSRGEVQFTVDMALLPDSLSPDKIPPLVLTKLRTR